MLAHDQPCLGLVGAANVLEYLLEHFQQKRASAAGEIQHGHAIVVGKASGNLELVFQNIVDGPNDEVHDGRRRVIDAVIPPILEGVWK